MDENNETTTKNKSLNISKKTSILLLFIVLIIIVGAICGNKIYTKGYIRAKNDIAELQGNRDWQQKQINELRNENKDARSRMDMIDSNVAAINSARSTNFSYTTMYADLTIESTTTFKSDKLASSDYKLLLVDILAKNKNSEDVYFSSGELKLKDKNNYEYTTFYNKDDLALPGGRTQTDYLALKPKEESRATIVFLITKPVSEVVLSNVADGKVLKTITL